MSGNYCIALSTKLRYFVKYLFFYGASEFLKNYLMITFYQHYNAGFLSIFLLKGLAFMLQNVLLSLVSSRIKSTRQYRNLLYIWFKVKVLRMI